MRDIKFRAWDKKQKVLFSIFDSVKCSDWFLPNWKNNYEIMQYTGLKDKNDVEIYEGDVVKGIDGMLLSSKKRVEFLGVIEFVENGYILNCYDKHNGKVRLPEIIEVIGNIYENPEILEGE